MRSNGYSGVFKVVVIGESGVGKTSVVQRFLYDRFDEQTNPTIGSVCVKKTVEGQNGPMTLNVWDTAGQERFQSLIPMYIRGSKACLLVVDTSTEIEFEELTVYFDSLYDQLESNCYICLCGNKRDKIERETCLSSLKDWANQRSLQLFLVSAKTGDGVENMFSEIALNVERRMRLETETGSSLPRLEKKSENCC